MLKKLALAAFAATSVLAAAPAEAGTCWYLESWQQSANPQYCRTVERINANGHYVWDITDGEGMTFQVVLWDDNVAEVIGFTSRPMQLRTSDDADGSVRIYWPDGFTFIFRPY